MATLCGGEEAEQQGLVLSNPYYMSDDVLNNQTRQYLYPVQVLAAESLDRFVLA